MKMTLTVKEAAAFTKLGEQQIRIGLQRNILPFGVAIGKPSKTRKGFTVYRYHIPIKQVEDYMGMKYSDFLKINWNVMRMKKIKRILGNTIMFIGLFIFILTAGVDDFNMSILKFLLIWTSLLGLSVILMFVGYKLTQKN